MSSTVTVTGKEGIGQTVTAKGIVDPRSVLFDIDNQLLRVTHRSGRVEDVDISGATTITATVASGVYTFTVS